MTKLKTLGIDEETHKLIKRIQMDLYENINLDFEIKKIINLLVIDPKKAEDLIIKNLTI